MKYAYLFFVYTLLSITACQQADRKASAPNFEQAPVPTSATSPKQDADAGAPVTTEVQSSADKAKDGLSETPQTFQTAAASSRIIDSAKLFIRTANIQFRTPDVLKATLAIEDIAMQHGGFVTQNHLENQQLSKREIKVSADSSLETIRYIVKNTVVLRVPNKQLDTTLRAIGRWAEYLDYRRVDANDVELDLMEHELERIRNTNFTNQLDADLQSKPADNNALRMRESALRGRAEADAARLSNLRLNDQIRYSTIKVHLYQRETSTQKLVPNERAVAAFSPGFWHSLGQSIANGWSGFLSVLVVLTGLWPLYLLFAIGYFGLKKIKKIA